MRSWREDDVIRVVLHGEVRRHAQHALRGELARARQLRIERALIDLSGVELVDEGGVAVLVRESRRAHDEDRELVLRPAPAPVHDIFVTSGADRFLRFLSEQDESTADDLTRVFSTRRR